MKRRIAQSQKPKASVWLTATGNLLVVVEEGRVYTVVTLPAEGSVFAENFSEKELIDNHCEKQEDYPAIRAALIIIQFARDVGASPDAVRALEKVVRVHHKGAIMAKYQKPKEEKLPWED